MIGLRRGTVDVSPYRRAWHDAFEKERTSLAVNAANLVLDVQHVGSTAVPGLDAKPIIDIAAAVRSKEDIPTLAEVLTHLGWIDRGDKGETGGYLFVKESAPECRTHHLHVVEIDTVQWRDYLAFRDILRQNQEVRLGYAHLKHELMERFPNDRASYTAAKQAFVASVLADHTTKRKV